MVSLGRPAIDPGTIARMRAAARGRFPAVVDVARTLVQTPSLSGEESAAAELVLGTMRSFGYDEVWSLSLIHI